MDFGFSEIIFILAIGGAGFTAVKIIKSEVFERKANKKIKEVINNPKLLKEKLSHPEIEINGKVEKFEKIIDRGEELNFSIEEHGVKIKKEEIKVPEEKKSKKNIKKND